MFPKQKQAILELLKSAEDNKNYTNKYLLPYKDFFDMTDRFTEFVCERLGGKQEYLTLIESLLKSDKDAQIFVELYGLEEDQGEQWIYAETLILFSKLSLSEIKQLFIKTDNVFPSSIGKLANMNEAYYVVDKYGILKMAALIIDNPFIYYCWWD